MKKIDILKYIFLTIFLFLFSIVTSIVFRSLLTQNFVFGNFSDSQASVIISIVEATISSIAIGFVLFQLKISELLNIQQVNIQEADFLLQYNQSFIQDNNMTFVESELEKFFHDQSYVIQINDDTRQLYVNYLVYLESLAPLILGNILKFQHIDDLMAYRYFIAVNNPYVQKDQLFRDADYYKGCFKIYSIWKSYRLQNNLKIPLNDYSLDLWIDFESYCDLNIQYRKIQKKDSLKHIAQLIYNTDKYIYPTAFTNVKKLQKEFYRLLNSDNLFNKNNIRVIEIDKKIAGVAVIISSKTFAKRPIIRHQNEKYHDVCKSYFDLLSDIFYEDTVYLACVSVDETYQNRGIAKYIIKHVIKEFSPKKILLDTLIENSSTNLYKKMGFKVVKEKYGYAYHKKPPKCVEMIYDTSNLLNKN